ncbi:hypothetical protein O0550_23300 [Brevibacillus halotolerans]|uniref:hypothetical protein n=1 Tax=Brevibacillus TaxID=55080 RepID=UPI00215CBABD|nr:MULTISPECIES: hypothetical protein [Brevibacillus]MCR8966077.1 hypothetical protein [Brevibacillus laterosporus]MCZ0838233.1 hypothetical protein [Brevibacillus halotolerans]
MNEEKGIDYKKLEFVDKEMKKFETKRQLAKSSGKATCKGGSVDCAGAYDTYYNYDRTTGKFIVQALSANAHEYVKLKGSTLGSSKMQVVYRNFKNKLMNLNHSLLIIWITTFMKIHLSGS